MKSSHVIPAVALAVSVSLFSGCGSKAAPLPSGTVSANSTAGAPVTMDLIGSSFENDGNTHLVRFAAKVTNPATQTRVGVTAQWKALDASGAIVGSYTHNFGALAPGASTVYVGGAGQFTGEPVSVKVEITDGGSLTDAAAAPTVKAGVPKIAPPDGYGINMYKDATDYTVTVPVTVTAATASTDLTAAVVLYDAKGKIVGMDFAEPDNAPAQLAAGEKINLQATVQVKTGLGAPVKAVAYAE